LGRSQCIIGKCVLQVAFSATPAAGRYSMQRWWIFWQNLRTHLPPLCRVLDVDCVVFRPRLLTLAEVDTLAVALPAEAAPVPLQFR